MAFGMAPHPRKHIANPFPSVPLAAVLFDMDGVVVDTASMHAAIWKDMFDRFLEERSRRTGEEFRAFDAGRDYRRHVDGRPRADGVRCFLLSRGIDLPWGSEADGPEQETIIGLGNRKNRLFRERIAKDAVRPFPGTMRLLHALRAAGIDVAIFSASRNMTHVLRAAGVEDLFGIRVDGRDVASLGIPGKPDPAMLLEAAARLGVEPARAAIIEDSIAGIEAGRRGGFARIIGIDRGGNRNSLRLAGAHLVVEDAGELAFNAHHGITIRTISTLPAASDAQVMVRAKLAGARPCAFLDYDGTLAPIVPDPDNALLPDGMRDALAALVRRCPVAIVSGRDVSVIRRLVGLPGLTYAGSHGFEIVGPEGGAAHLETGVAFLAALDAAEGALRRGLADIVGHVVERQRFSIAVHFRNASPVDAKRIAATVDAVLAEMDGLRQGAGKKVIRIQPAIDWDKGRAVRWLLERMDDGGEGRIPIYIGDDVTDEDAFRALAGTGVSLVVQGEEDRPTSADYALAGTGDVRRFLGLLADLCNEPKGKCT